MANYTDAVVAETVETVVSRIIQSTLDNAAVIRPTVLDMSAQVRDGMDELDVPRFTKPTVLDKAADTDLTAAVVTIAKDRLSLNKHKAIPWSIEDKANIQSAVALSAKIIEDASVRLMAQVDDDILIEIQAVSTSGPDHKGQLSGTSNNELTQADILEARKLLDNQDVPSEDRTLLVPPEQERVMLTIAGFVQADQYGSNQPIQRGEIGMVYGDRVVKSNSASLSDTEFNYYHRSHVAYATQSSARMEDQRQALGLKTDFVLSILYGTETMDNSGTGGGVRGVTFDESA